MRATSVPKQRVGILAWGTRLLVSMLDRSEVWHWSVPADQRYAIRSPGRLVADPDVRLQRLAADRSIDAVRSRFGRSAVGYATVALSERGAVPDEFRELAERDG